MINPFIHKPDRADHISDPEYFKSLRAAIGWTQNSLATMFGQSKRHIQRYEAGHGYDYATQYILESMVAHAALRTDLSLSDNKQLAHEKFERIMCSYIMAEVRLRLDDCDHDLREEAASYGAKCYLDKFETMQQSIQHGVLYGRKK